MERKTDGRVREVKRKRDGKRDRQTDWLTNIQTDRYAETERGLGGCGLSKCERVKDSLHFPDRLELSAILIFDHSAEITKISKVYLHSNCLPYRTMTENCDSTHFQNRSISQQVKQQENQLTNLPISHKSFNRLIIPEHWQLYYEPAWEKRSKSKDNEGTSTLKTHCSNKAFVSSGFAPRSACVARHRGRPCVEHVTCTARGMELGWEVWLLSAGIISFVLHDNSKRRGKKEEIQRKKKCNKTNKKKPIVAWRFSQLEVCFLKFCL